MHSIASLPARARSCAALFSLVVPAMALSSGSVRAQAPPVAGVVAGSGQPGFGGDSGPASAALLNTPSGIAFDAAGNLYIADSYNQRIRKIDLNGTITTLGGTGQPGFSGDNGPALQAQLNFPSGIAVDAQGNVFVSDTKNNRVRRIDPGGTITTVVGDGTAGNKGDNGPGAAAEVNTPGGLAVDAAGDLFIADALNNIVRKLTPGGTITTVAGNGSKGFSGDHGPAVAAQLKDPAGVAVDAQGNLFIGDTGSGRVRKVDASGTITTVAGSGNPFGLPGDNGPALAAGISTPSGVAVDSQGNLYLADTLRSAVRKVAQDGTITTVPGAYSNPIGLAVNKSGTLDVADSGTSRILTFGAPAGPGTGTVGAGAPASGDIDGSGKVDVKDAINALRIAVGSFAATADQIKAADVNKDGVVDIKDAILILRLAVGL